MTVTVAKRFDFHAAHRLPHHDGQCRRLHGHTYGLEVAVTGPIKTETGESDEGMVLDFTQLKDLYKMLIEPHVEHQNMNETLKEKALEVPYVLWTNGPPECGTDSSWYEPLTTAEGLALWILKCFEHGLYKLMGLSSLHYRIRITVWETPTSFAQIGSTWRDDG